MGEKTGIEWADHTLNPWWGCEKISPACTNCYAEDLAERYPQTRGLWGKDAPRKIGSEKTWHDPVVWNRKAEKAGRKARVFCASMADVFEDRRDLDAPRARLWQLIRETPNLIWMLLTKRPENARQMLLPLMGANNELPPELPANVWLGTTVENQEQAERRIPDLTCVRGVKFVSCEPLLGPVDLANVRTWSNASGDHVVRNALEGKRRLALGLRTVDATAEPIRAAWSEMIHGLCARSTAADKCQAISWVICGGESGKDARPMRPEWARSLRDQCHAAGVPFFFKQWGEHAPVVNMFAHAGADERMERVGKKRAGALLDGMKWKEFPA
jgi:protein gp37